MFEFIIPAEQLRFISSVMKDDFFNQSYLCSKLAEIYSIVFYPDRKTSLPINPFWDCKTQNPKREMMEKFQCAFFANDLYLELKEQFEAKGYVIKSESKEPIVNKDRVCTLPYYPGMSYIFVPRT